MANNSFDYISVLDSIRAVRIDVRNWNEARPGQVWYWSCMVCGDSKRDARKARFGVTRKGSSFVCNCFNCGYTNNFVMYLRDYHPDQYRNIIEHSTETTAREQTFDLNDLVNKCSDNVLKHLFYMDRTNDTKEWLDILTNKKISLTKTNIKKLHSIFIKSS